MSEYQEVIFGLKDELARACVNFGLIDTDLYNKLDKHSKNTGENLFDLIRKDGLISGEGLLEKLQEKYGISYDKNAVRIDPDYKNFPYKFCYKSGLMPIADDGAILTVGVAAPSSLNSIKNLALLTGRKVSAKFVEITLFENKPTNDSSLIFPDQQVDDQVKVADQNNEAFPVELTPSPDDDALSVKFPKQDNTSRAIVSKNKVLKKSFVGGDVITGVEDILSQAVDDGVSDIHFEVFRDTANIRFRKNGSLLSVSEYKGFITENYAAVVARLKILANLDIAEKRLPQDGKIAFQSKSGVEVDFRVSILPTNLGERVVIRILNSSGLAVSIDKLGFKDSQLQEFTEAIDSPQGLVLVTGPTGSGKSTTLYGAINYLNKPDVNILTAEDPVEYTLSGISQVQVRENIGLTFANALRSFLRQDPEIILVGEIRDAETADIATKAALTGHLVLSTLHTNSAIGAITRLINMGLPEYLVSSALSLVVAQRLIRVNCKNCSTQVEVTSLEQFDKKVATMLHGAKMMRGKGCQECSSTGYAGRKAVHEVLKISPKIQKAINQKASANEIYQLAIEDGFESISHAAVRYILSGELSAEEYLRVVPTEDLDESL